MNAEFLIGKSPEFAARARKLARILDERFDAFGALLADEAIDHAAIVLEQIEASGARLIFADDETSQVLQ